MASNENLTVGELCVNLSEWQVYRNGNKVAMTKQSFDLLLILAKARPNTVSQQALIQQIWVDRVVSDQSLKQAVKRLRESLADLGDDYIKAVRGRGYRLECNTVSFSQPPPSRKKYIIATISGLALMVVLYWVTAKFAGTNYQHYTPMPQLSELDNQTSTEEAYRLYHSGLKYYQRYRPEDAEIAITQFKQAIDIDPKFAKAYAALSDAQSLTGELEQAIITAQHAISLDRNESSAHKALGHAYSLKGWFQKAIESYQRALELNPNNLAAISNTGFHLKELGRLDEALSWNLRALRLEPKNAIVYLHIAETLNGLGLPQHALKWFNKAKAIRPDYSQLYHSLTYFHLASGENHEAEKVVTQALKILPDNPDILMAAGDVALAEHDYDRALELFQRLTPSEEGNKLSHYATLRIGQVYWLKKQSNDAKLMLDLALTRTESLLAEGDEWPGNYVDIASIYAIKQSHHESLSWLHNAVDNGWVNYKRLHYDPAFATMQDLPEFSNLIAKTKAKVEQMQSRALEVSF